MPIESSSGVLSSAQVELEHSDFTPLPDYDRLISVLKGELELKIGQGERGALEARTVRGFDGGVPVESWGALCGFQFDAAEGRMSGLCAADCVTRRWQLPVGGSGACASEISKLHACAVLRGGDLTLSDAGVQAAAGELLLCERADASFPSFGKQSGDCNYGSSDLYTIRDISLGRD